MTCEEVLLLISGHLDRENSVEEEAQLQAHLHTCSACRELMSVLERTDEAVRGLTEPVPEKLCENVMEQIRRETAGKKRRIIWRSLSAAAALAVVLGIGALVLPKQKTEPAMDSGTAAQQISVQAAAYAPQEARVMVSSTDACFSLPATLAEERRADVVLLAELPPELRETADYETVGDGWRLYRMEDPQAASRLSEQYFGELAMPSVKDPDCKVSYVLIAATETE